MHGGYSCLHFKNKIDKLMVPLMKTEKIDSLGKFKSLCIPKPQTIILHNIVSNSSKLSYNRCFPQALDKKHLLSIPALA